jgi:hypothetical protein
MYMFDASTPAQRAGDAPALGRKINSAVVNRSSFRDMSAAERTVWMGWAKAHDWGGAPARWAANGSMLVEGVDYDARTKEAIIVPAEIAPPAELRAWAGY